MPSQASHYAILGLESDCELLQVKKAYRERLLSTHPDKTRSGSGTSTGPLSIEEIKEAYRILSDPKTRSQYDALLAESCKKSGFNNTGEGLESFSLDKFDYDSGTSTFSMNCPRCHVTAGFELTEDMLDNHGAELPDGSYFVVVQCSACSLWLNVTFDIVDE
ncbi:LANO_0G02894g1_1 [Lachancea nothofagi CBS 11611]|uniref:Diphthamide biosynthesis protein 4 n=1 Tax=Lachancea nothofagi CBS 11611 TaxID=1266666 RepID=A0A1G4KFF6_9SACH|nr:LANO_0G02894g1_1 [Lachancea nothofagi CBS 11611]